MFKIIPLCLMSLLLTACTAAGAFVVNTPARLFGDYAVKKDIPFGLHGLKLDVYMPEAQAQPADVVVFFYGGGWNTGSKDFYAFVGDALPSRGYVVVIPDYRKYPEVKFPDFVEDGAEAVAWTMQHAGEYGGDAASIHLMGHSAGAHLAALLASDGHYLSDAKATAYPIRSFAGLAGPYHFIPEKGLYKQVFGPPDRYPLMQVDRYINGKEPPMLLMQGAKDTTVESENLEILRDAVLTHGGVVETRTYAGRDHVGMLTPLSRPLRGAAPILDDVDAFFAAHHAK